MLEMGGEIGLLWARISRLSQTFFFLCSSPSSPSHSLDRFSTSSSIVLTETKYELKLGILVRLGQNIYNKKIPDALFN